MYIVSKRLEISCAHNLQLSYPSPCQHTHGHNWVVTVKCRSKNLDSNGMVIDFTEIKRLVYGRLDHKHLNDVLLFNPTAENIAKWIVDTVPHCFEAHVQESEGNVAIYTQDEEV